ncbi:hypothetical protein [Nitrospira sp. Nam80]
MIPRMNAQSIGLVIFFVLCQVIGTMCILPDISIAEQMVSLVEDVMTCPMDGTIMCPPLATSSPERQGKPGSVPDVDTMALQHSLDLATNFASVLCPRSIALSIVPLSISSSSVLRI